MTVNFKEFTKEEFITMASVRYCPEDFGIENECYLNGMEGCERCWHEATKNIEFKVEEKETVDAVEKLYQAVKLISAYYGTEIELDMMVEESSELIKAIMKHKRYNNEETRQNIVEELADVYLVVHQLINLLEVDEEVIEIANKKAKRQLERIKKEIGGK